MLNWIGKDAVVKHHKEVPFRLLEPDAALSCPKVGAGDTPNSAAASGNLIVQGDNLHALKALLPRYAGQVKCIYIDPPYQPLSRTANFTAYTSRGFGWSEQQRLAKWLARVARRGCYVLINNADTPEVRELYRSAFEERGVLIRMQAFETTRNINSAPDARGGGQELTVWNY